MAGHSFGVGGEAVALEALEAILGPPAHGETWIGDDAAVLCVGGEPLLFASDLIAEGVHFSLAHTSLADVGWKALAVNISDVAAMGGRPFRAVVAIAGAFGPRLEDLYRGLLEASSAYGCPIVGGDLSAPANGDGLVVSVAILGTTEGRAPVLRSGARAGDRLYVTGALGAAAAGLRLLAKDAHALGACVDAHRRPRPRVVEGEAAARLGARAMIDISDGLGIDLDRLARASGLGVALEQLPVAQGATEAEALEGGEDYELLFAVPPEVAVEAAFEASGLTRPVAIGELVADGDRRQLRGRPFAPAGYLHDTAPARSAAEGATNAP